MINVDTGLVRRSEEHSSYQMVNPYQVSHYEQLITDLFSQMQVGIWLIDQQGSMVECNAISSRYLGLERSEVLYRPISYVISQLDTSQPNYKQFVSFLTNTHPQQNEMELEWDTNDGRHLFLIRRRLIMDSGSNFSGTFFIMENKTEDTSLAKQAQLSNRLATIGQIAAGTAHEIRNPLTSIRGFLQVIGHKLKENGQQKEHGYIDIMLKEINRINNLVSEFLLLSKPRVVNRHPVMLQKILDEILPIIQSEAILHNIEVKFQNCVKGSLYLEADSELIKQIFLNLCKNAIEAMVDDGMLTITITKDELNKYAIVEIADQGTGIPDYVKDKIFDPFFTTKENGTGLGLPICKQILRELCGKMEVSSSEKGTIFRVYLLLTTHSS
jgi:two-component system, sporulation sensor kinase E